VGGESRLFQVVLGEGENYFDLRVLSGGWPAILALAEDNAMGKQ